MPINPFGTEGKLLVLMKISGGILSKLKENKRRDFVFGEGDVITPKRLAGFIRQEMA